MERQLPIFQKGEAKWKADFSSFGWQLYLKVNCVSQNFCISSTFKCFILLPHSWFIVVELCVLILCLWNVVTVLKNKLLFLKTDLRIWGVSFLKLDPKPYFSEIWEVLFITFMQIAWACERPSAQLPGIVALLPSRAGGSCCALLCSHQPPRQACDPLWLSLQISGFHAIGIFSLLLFPLPTYSSETLLFRSKIRHYLGSFRKLPKNHCLSPFYDGEKRWGGLFGLVAKVGGLRGKRSEGDLTTVTWKNPPLDTGLTPPFPPRRSNQWALNGSVLPLSASHILTHSLL